MRTNIPVALTHNNIRIEGSVISLSDGELKVIIKSPYSKVSARVHNFFGSRGRMSFQEGEGLSLEGKKIAGSTLVDIYEKCEYFSKHITELRSEFDPIRNRLNDSYQTFKNSVPSFKVTDSEDGIRKHQSALQSILWLNHEFYKIVSEKHVELKDVGLDMFNDLVTVFLR